MDISYGVEVEGGCLGAWLPDGTRLVADPSAPLRPLDLCSVRIKDGDGRWARFIRGCGEGFTGATKVYLGRIDHPAGEMLLVGQLVPPVVCLIPMAEVESVHRVTGCVGMAATMGEDDVKALQLIAGFARFEQLAAGSAAATLAA